ncbi:hypothetical protein D3C86_970410 [compost metagenome]
MHDGLAAVQLHDAVQRDAQLLAAFLHQLTSAGAFFPQHPFLLADLLDMHFFLPGPVMVVTHHGDDWVAPVKLRVKALVEFRQGQDRHIDIEVEQAIQGLFFRGERGFQLDVRMPLHQFVGQVHGNRRRHRAQAQHAGLALLETLQQLHGFILLAEQALGDRVELVPGGTHFDKAAAAMEQFHGKLLLQGVDLLTDRGLADAQILGGEGETAGLGHRMK